MVSSAVVSEKATNKSGAIFTFLVPSPHGCNLNCPFCIIRQRRENCLSNNLSPQDYSNFIKDASSRIKTCAISIQGYEPLLEKSFEYTREILATGRNIGIPTGMVTNGVGLSSYIDELRELEPDRIAVSLDAAMPEYHDRQRGQVGAWNATVEGLRQAVTGLSPKTELVVASVLFPKRRDQLEKMPPLLREIGIKHWIINLLQKVDGRNAGGTVGDRSTIFRDLAILKAAAEAYDIEFAVDDEFDSLRKEDCCENVIDINRIRINRLPQPSNLFRLLPTGQCSSGTDILKQVPDDAPAWIPNREHAGSFIQRMHAA